MNDRKMMALSYIFRIPNSVITEISYLPRWYMMYYILCLSQLNISTHIKV